MALELDPLIQRFAWDSTQFDAGIQASQNRLRQFQAEMAKGTQTVAGGRGSRASADGLDQQARAAERARRAYESLVVSMGGTEAVQMRTARAARTLNDAFNAGHISLARYNDVLQRVEKHYGDADRRANTFRGTLSRLAPLLAGQAVAQAVPGIGGFALGSALAERGGRGLGIGAAAATAGIVSTVAAGAALLQTARATDEIRLLNAQLQAFIGNATGAQQAFQGIVATANATGTSIESNAILMRRLAVAQEDLGATTGQLIQFQRTVQQLMIASGTSTVEAAAGTIQLAQALASGRVQGDEFRSLMEAFPVLMRQAAEGLYEMGIATEPTIGALNELREAGALTAQDFFEAILRSAPEAERLFEQMPDTIARSSQKMGNNLKLLAANVGELTGVADALRGSINQLGEAIAALNPILEASGGFFDKWGAGIVSNNQSTQMWIDRLKELFKQQFPELPEGAGGPEIPPPVVPGTEQAAQDLDQDIALAGELRGRLEDTQGAMQAFVAAGQEVPQVIRDQIAELEEKLRIQERVVALAREELGLSAEIAGQRGLATGMLGVAERRERREGEVGAFQGRLREQFPADELQGRIQQEEERLKRPLRSEEEQALRDKLFTIESAKEAQDAADDARRKNLQDMETAERKAIQAAQSARDDAERQSRQRIEERQDLEEKFQLELARLSEKEDPLDANLETARIMQRLLRDLDFPPDQATVERMRETVHLGVLNAREAKATADNWDRVKKAVQEAMDAQAERQHELRMTLPGVGIEEARTIRESELTAMQSPAAGQNQITARQAGQLRQRSEAELMQEELGKLSPELQAVHSATMGSVDALSEFAVGLATGTQSIEQFSDTLLDIAGIIMRQVLETTVAEPVSNALIQGLSGLAAGMAGPTAAGATGLMGGAVTTTPGGVPINMLSGAGGAGGARAGPTPLFPGGVPRRQHGGPVAPGQWVVVGEHGPEFLRGGSGGGQVVPMGRSGGGSAPIINITNKSSGAQVASAKPRVAAGGGHVIDVLVQDSVGRMASGGGLDPLLRNSGVRRRGIARN